MKQKIVLGSVIALTGACALWVGGAYYAGKSAESTLDKQYKWLAEQPYFVIKARTYQRGWFSSTETATVAINPSMYRFLLEKEGTPLPVFEVTYTNHVLHGPFPLIGQYSLRPAKAVVQTEFQFSPETQKLLSRFFGAQKPIEVENRIGFNDDGIIQLKVPGFDYEETLSGIKSKWEGLNATIDYGGDFNRVHLVAHAPGMTGAAKGKGNFSFNGFDFSVDHVRGKSGLMLGNTHANLGHFTLDIEDDSPLKVALENLSYTGELSEVNNFINGEATINLAKLVLNDKAYGPAELQAEATHLHGPTLAKLDAEFTKLQKRTLTREELTNEIVKLAKAQGMPLLTNDPHFGIRKLEVKLPEGTLKFSVGLGLKGFKEKDLDNPVEFVSKLSAKADFTVPRKVVETLVMWQARNMFGGPDSGVSNADLDYLAGQFVEGQINRLTDQKLIRVDGDLLSAAATLEGGEFTLNNILVPLPWQEDKFKKKVQSPAK
ncbi:MAG: YdgA family protein [Formivibrio sp.]|nr:YdgA family protein [Formivibrio sp.]